MAQGEDHGPPVDPGARFRLAALLEDVAAGRITNDAFEAVRPGAQDPAAGEIFEAALVFSDDARIHRARLTAEDREHLARWALFLRTPPP